MTVSTVCVLNRSKTVWESIDLWLSPGRGQGANEIHFLLELQALLCLVMIFSAHYAFVVFKEQRSPSTRATGYTDSPGNHQRRSESKTKAAQHARVGPPLSHSFKYCQRRLSRTGPQRLGRSSQGQRRLRSPACGQSSGCRQPRIGRNDREILSDGPGRRSFAARSPVTLAALAGAATTGSFSANRTGSRAAKDPFGRD